MTLPDFRGENVNPQKATELGSPGFRLRPPTAPRRLPSCGGQGGSGQTEEASYLCYLADPAWTGGVHPGLIISGATAGGKFPLPELALRRISACMSLPGLLAFHSSGTRDKSLCGALLGPRRICPGRGHLGCSPSHTLLLCLPGLIPAGTCEAQTTKK